MIQINEVADKVTVPVIDFKFQNTGDATALMWQFEIEVLESKLDPTPALEFGFSACRIGDFWGYEESDKHLQIYATNHGYGPAENCEIILEER
jgi:hypothetical protein